jgi:hypothetical protein
LFYIIFLNLFFSVVVVDGKFFADGLTFSAIHGEGSAVGQAIESESRFVNSQDI